MASIFEVARNDIIAEMALITTANGYRNDVVQVLNAIRAPFKINHTETPEIGVVLGNRYVSIEDASWKVSDILCDVYVQGTVQADDKMEKSASLLNDSMESLAHDISRVIYGFTTKNINEFTHGRWNVSPNSPIKIMMGIDFGDKINKGVVRAEFQIQLRAVGADFD